MARRAFSARHAGRLRQVTPVNMQHARPLLLNVSSGTTSVGALSGQNFTATRCVAMRLHNGLRRLAAVDKPPKFEEENIV